MSSRSPLEPPNPFQSHVLETQDETLSHVTDPSNGTEVRIPGSVQTIRLEDGRQSLRTATHYVRGTDGHLLADGVAYACRVPGCAAQLLSRFSIRTCGGCGQTVCIPHAITTPDGILCAPCRRLSARARLVSWFFSFEP